jgi:O-methyltransferase involved in polyketide biosynthesis
MPLKLTDVSDTLWIPLFGKAIESKRMNRLLNDPFAVEIANKACELNPSLQKWWKSLSRESQGLMVWRNHSIDKLVTDYLEKHPNGTVVNLGAGLCTRFNRLDNGKVKWIELDLPPVKDAWLNFNNETDRHQFWIDNIFESTWLEKVAAIQDDNVLFIAEGLFMYFSRQQVKGIFEMIGGHLTSSHLVFEAYSKFALMRPHPDVLKTGAKRFKKPWGIYNGKEFEKWLPNIKHISDDYFLQNKKALERVPLTHKLGANIPVISKAGKIVYLVVT